MRTLLMANNWGGLQIAKYLRERNEDIVGLIIHPEANRKFGSEILATLNLPPNKLWTAPDLRNPDAVNQIRTLAPDMIITAFWAYLLKPDIIAIPKHGCINLHPAYLPKNRGWHANVWPILDGTPAGVTIHYIDAGADTGDIIAQRCIPVEPEDTGGSLHIKLTHELVTLFKETWAQILSGKNQRMAQNSARATSHRRADMDALDLIDLDKSYKARDLINLLRARTYPPYPSAYFIHDSRKVYVRVQLSTENQLDADGPVIWE
jgi:methionyl-tRNA formyltransferase